MLIYLTGGTTGRPRLIRYDRSRWNQVVHAKMRILQAYGVGADDRVLICHPFAPWAIGPVHAEAAWLCGAHVFPVGLGFDTPEIMELIREFAPTRIAGGARILIRLHELLLRGGRAPESASTLFVAGSPLTPEVRQEAAACWNAVVVDVYGMAEFDALGAEIDGSNGVLLLPHLDFALRGNDGSVAACTPGASGELLVRWTLNDEWVATGDSVKIVGQRAWPGDTRQVPAVALLGRMQPTLHLSDGSAISEAQVSMVQRRFAAVKYLQLFCETESGRDVLVARVVLLRDGAAAEDVDSLVEGLIRAIREINIDVADAVRSNSIGAVRALICSEGDLFVTTRGKMPLVVQSPRRQSAPP
jgi:phenylacetate-coenzyme A ligase PaaK-like adenylate-forming protein